MEKDWKEIILKLMAKAEDPATTLEERNTIVDRITILMAKHGIEEAMLDAGRDKKEYKLVNQSYRLGNPYPAQKAKILYNVSKAFGCESIYIDDRTRVRVFGFDNDQEKVFMLYGSLVIQMMNGLMSAQVDKPKSVHGKSYNLSWINGYTITVCKRVRDAYTKAQNEMRESTTGMDLVLLDKSVAVRNAFRAEYPHTFAVRSNTTVTHAGAYSAGVKAGNRADIGQTRVGGSTRKSIGN